MKPSPSVPASVGPAPASPAPESPAPESPPTKIRATKSRASESLVPESLVPESLAPEALAPESLAPAGSAPVSPDLAGQVRHDLAAAGALVPGAAAARFPALPADFPRDPDAALALVVGDRRLHPGGREVPLHAHRRGQLMFVLDGGMRLMTEAGSWVAPPGRACWVPGGLVHGAHYARASELVTVYIAPSMAAALPADCRVVALGGLLRELVLACEPFAWNRPLEGRDRVLAELLVAEIGVQPEIGLHLPDGRDPRLRRVTAALRERPDDLRSIEAFAAASGASARTLARLFRAETGLSFTEWRGRLRLLVAVERLLDGAPVNEVAFDIGYGGASSFTTMFTRAMGETPARFARERCAREMARRSG